MVMAGWPAGVRRRASHPLGGPHPPPTSPAPPDAALLGAEYARLVMHGLFALIAGHRDDRAMAGEHLAGRANPGHS